MYLYQIEMEVDHFDWKDHKARLEYEKKMKEYKEWRWNWSFFDKFMWFLEFIVVEGFLVVLLYGGSAYVMRDYFIKQILELVKTLFIGQCQKSTIVMSGSATSLREQKQVQEDLEIRSYICATAKYKRRFQIE